MKRLINILMPFVVIGIFTFLFAFYAVNTWADTILNNQIKIKVDTNTVSYDIDNVKWETVEDGSQQPCPCQMLSFRALQLLAGQFKDGVMPRDDIRIFTGWTTEGPKELLVEKMGWNDKELSFTANATPTFYLQEKDMVFYFIQKSTNRCWKVWATDLHAPAFFEYRTLIKTNSATADQKKLFKNVIKPQAIRNLENIPLVDKFKIQEVAYYDENEVLHLPSTFISNGLEIGVDFKKITDVPITFQLITTY